jgi:hypothetical protein
MVFSSHLRLARAQPVDFFGHFEACIYSAGADSSLTGFSLTGLALTGS